MAQAAVATPGQLQRRKEAKVKVTGSGPKECRTPPWATLHESH
jgi:hypothetical protein